MFKHPNPRALGESPRLRTDRRQNEPKDLLCASCQNPVTKESAAIEVQGSHQHTRTNPAHITFRFGCFAHAAGCRDFGPLTAEHSWFNGYRWRAALCGRCGTHLGWRFEGTGNGFYGLILAKLISPN